MSTPLPPTVSNPVKLERIRQGMSGAEFGRQVGISPAALVAIEDGRTLEPKPETLVRMDTVLGKPAGTVQRMLAIWRAGRLSTGPVLSAKAQAVLAMTPGGVRDEFDSFQAWREVFASTPFAFARMLGINHAFVRNYETGFRSSRGMSNALQRALMVVLRVSPEYLAALSSLDPGHDDDPDVGVLPDNAADD